MEENKTENKVSSASYTVPGAIVIAGLIIAGAIYSQGSGSAPSAGQVAAPSIAANAKLENLKPISAADHLLGDPQAPIKIVEFSDLECPFCKTFHKTMLQVMQEYGAKGQVAWVYRHFPLDQLHSKARKEAEAAECAFKLGGNDQFWTYINKVFEITPSNNGLDLAQLPVIASSMGLDEADFIKCQNNGATASVVDAQYQDAVAAGGNGTPFPVVITPDGKKIALQGAIPFEGMKQLIDGLLAEKR
ncbi:MAG: thioredoxin domain-containing protein [Patescibacteria group bacterium]